MIENAPMRVVESYIQYIENLAYNLAYTADSLDNSVAVELALNGELSKTLRKLVPMEDLQNSGAFFTSESMAEHLVSHLPNDILTDLHVLDAACGGGNLLLAYARRLPLENNFQDTIFAWGQNIRGIDLHHEFVRATRARLALLAVLRGTTQKGHNFMNCSIPILEAAFPYIYAGNSLEIEWPKTQVVLLNPPFNLVPVPAWCKWATGRVSQAALFIMKCLKESENGNIIRAILPDVLRSGSRYNKWRKQVEKLAKVESIEVLGQFDSKTNVEVFLLTLTVSSPFTESYTDWIFSLNNQAYDRTIGSLCEVKVGRVVPHRDLEEGEEYPYLDVSHLPQWGTINPGEAYRKFSGPTFETPFVVIRRNSRATDTSRAVATLVKSAIAGISEQVAIENHLIIVKPKSGLISDCERLLLILKDMRTNDWLNTRIRCRHLTVNSIQSIPWWQP